MSQDVRPDIKIRPAIFPDDVDTVRRLFLAYADSVPVKLDFQGFDQEVAGMPGKYAIENGGSVYLVFRTTPSPPSNTTSQENGVPPDSNSTAEPSAQDQAIGAVGLRRVETTNNVPSCELKRLYLTPESRGLGVSKLLMDVVLAQARQLGYKEMFLDTLGSMTTARTLYEKYGFVQIGGYYESVPDAVFYKLEL